MYKDDYQKDCYSAGRIKDCHHFSCLYFEDLSILKSLSARKQTSYISRWVHTNYFIIYML